MYCDILCHIVPCCIILYHDGPQLILLLGPDNAFLILPREYQEILRVYDNLRNLW